MDGVVSYIGEIAQASVGLTFLIAALTKARDPRAFATKVAAFELLPMHAAAYVAGLVIIAEALVATSLLGRLLAPVGLLAALGLLTLFIFAVSVNLIRGRRVECGCFGGAGEHISRKTLARLSGLTAAAALALLIEPIRARPDALELGVLKQVLVVAHAAAVLLIASWVLALDRVMRLVRVALADGTTERSSSLQGGI